MGARAGWRISFEGEMVLAIAETLVARDGEPGLMADPLPVSGGWSFFDDDNARGPTCALVTNEAMPSVADKLARARAALQATGRDVVVKGTEAMPVGRIVELDEGNEWVLGEMDK